MWVRIGLTAVGDLLDEREPPPALVVSVLHRDARMSTTNGIPGRNALQYSTHSRLYQSVVAVRHPSRVCT